MVLIHGGKLPAVEFFQQIAEQKVLLLDTTKRKKAHGLTIHYFARLHRQDSFLTSDIAPEMFMIRMELKN